MIIKKADDKRSQVKLLEQLLQEAPADKKKLVQRELFNVKAGIKGEANSAYLIDFSFTKSKNVMVIHDLRLKVDGRIAQIDHLIVNRAMHFICLETKHFHAGVKINDNGEFLMWNSYKKAYEGMPSPLQQNERHIAVLEDALNIAGLPTRVGMKLKPSFHSLVLVDAKSRIIREKGFDSSAVIKADLLDTTYDKIMGKQNALGLLSKVVSSDTIKDITMRLVAMHKPIEINYRARFGIKEPRRSPTPNHAATPKNEGHAKPKSTVSTKKNDASQHKCKHCDGTALSVEYGKYGYYFKCKACSKNTPIYIKCDVCNSKKRVRKEKQNFFIECKMCKTSSLFYTNAG